MSQNKTAMQDDVAIAKVARAIMLARGGCNVTDWNERTWNPAIQQVWDMARAAMAATREIDAEALRGIVSGQDETEGAAQTNIADWLQQRANEVKECGDG